MLSTDKAWEKFGRDEPYFGVLADEKFTASKFRDNREEFFASGRHSVASLITRFEKHFGTLKRNRALDHGCGVGRLSLPLAADFLEVLGLDVSPSMLAEATANATQYGTANLRFAPADDRLTHAAGVFDFVNSYMVLQHIRVGRGLRILAQLLDRVAPGGGFHVHLSIRTDAIGSRSLWWASHHVPGVKIWQNLCARRPWNAPAMQMNDYPLKRTLVLLAAHGISDVLISTERHAKFLTCSLLGRKPLDP